MYNFISSDSHIHGEPILPAEAMKINGKYIEDEIDGYRTLYTKGRESLSAEILSFDGQRRHGQTYRGRRYPEREITVGFQLICSGPSDFRAKWNALAGILGQEEAQLIFADEADKYFTGTVTEISEPDPGRLNIVSEFKIVCSDPFKYKIEPTIVTASVDNNTTVVVDYQGTAPTRPQMIAEMYESPTDGNMSGDTAFIAFINESGGILEFGDKEYLENLKDLVMNANGTVTEYSTERLLNDYADQMANYGAMSSGAPWTNAGTVASGYLQELPVIADPNTQPDNWTGDWDLLQGGEDEVEYLYPDSYGSGSGLHGPCIIKSLPVDSGGGTASKYFLFGATLKFHTKKRISEAVLESGFMKIILLDEDDNELAGLALWKYTGSTRGRAAIELEGHGDIKTYTDIDYYYDKDMGEYRRNGVTYHMDYFNSPRIEFGIRKTGGTFTFYLWIETLYENRYICRNFPFRDDSLTNKRAKKVAIAFAKNGSQDPITNIGVQNIRFWKYDVANTYSDNTQWANVRTGIFKNNDILIVDCNDASARVARDYLHEGQSMDRYGKIGNDWEDFVLEPGRISQYHLACSDWTTKKPTLKVKYREAYL